MQDTPRIANDMGNKARKMITAVVGCTVLAIGLALLVLPGPAFIVLVAGLAILSTEFAWARRLLRKAKERISDNSTKSTRD